MRGLAAKENFAGVRTSSPESLDNTDLSCCAYGRSCILFADNDLAASLDAEQHLQPWLDNESLMVDRYDVRLLLQDTAQISPSTQRRVSASQTANEHNIDEELDYERYRDLQPELRNPRPRSEPEPAVAEEVTGSEEQTATRAYAAVPFAYDVSESAAVQDAAPAEPLPTPAADAVPDVDFVPSLAVPASLQSHIPTTERMHKIILQTAKFVRQAGGQTEFVLRVKQAANPNFSFLEPNDQRHPYFRWLVSTKPEDMITIDAAPSAVVDSVLPGPSSNAVKPPNSNTGSSPAAQHSSKQDPELAEKTQLTEAQPQPATAPDGTMSVDAQSAAQAQALPVADMQALAKRIGMASKVTAQPSMHPAKSMTVPGLGPGSQQSQAVSQSTAAVSAPGAVPHEIQAIIQKLVLFIKKAGPRFEATVRNKEKANPRFAFLLPWNQYHAFYRRQLVDILGQATADEVIALRASITPESAPAQPAAASALLKQPGSVSVGHVTDSQASQAAAADLHDQASAAIPAGSQLADALADADSASTGGSKRSGLPAVTDIPLTAAAAPAVSSGNSEAGIAQLSQSDVDAAEKAEAQVKAVAASSSPPTAASKPSPSGVTLVRSNPRFASKPIKLEPTADSQEPEPSDKAEGHIPEPSLKPGLEAKPVVKREPDVETLAKQEFQAECVKAESGTAEPVKPETVMSEPMKSESGKAESAMAEPAKAEPKLEPVKQEKHAAHAAAFSLEAVMEAQSVLINERHQKPQPDMTEDEKKAHRRRLVRQMLETKQKSAADAQEEKRKMHQSALAKYRQAFASDTEEEVIHMKLEDDETYEAPEPGEIVDEPEGKPVSGPVLSAPSPSPLPSLEALIKPRQDLVPQQRTFPLPSPAAEQSSRRSERGAEAGTASESNSSEDASSDRSDRRHKHRHKHKSSRSSSNDSRDRALFNKLVHKYKHRRRSRSGSRDSKAHFKEWMRKQKHKRRSRHSSRRKQSKERKQNFSHKRQRHPGSSSSDSGHSECESPRRGLSKRSKRDIDDSTGKGVEDDAEALRAKVRAMLGGL